MVNTVFDSFPFAIEEIELVKFTYSTITGNRYEKVGPIEAIIDEGNATALHNQSPNAASVDSDTLLYVRPEQMPTLDCEALSAEYGVVLNNKIYSIEDAALGKNQDAGYIEHIELKIRQRSAIEYEESE